MESIIRIKSIKIKNMKNVKNGITELEQSIDETGYVKESDIIGIYGQNGSGKTVVVEVLKIFKELISGKNLSKETIKLISIETSSGELEYEFYVFLHGRLRLFKYKVTLKKIYVKDEETDDDKESFNIVNEELYFLDLPKEKGKKYKVLADFSTEISPKNLKDFLISNHEDRIKFEVSKAKLEERSLLFSNFFLEKISVDEFKELVEILKIMKSYGRMNIAVIENRDSGLINANAIIPLSFRHKDIQKDDIYWKNIFKS